MRAKLGWILFCVMAVAVIVLSSVLIWNNARWKSGDELLDISVEEVESAYLYHNVTSSDTPTIKEYELSKAEIEYIIQEFRSSKFEKSNEQIDAGSSEVTFKMKDGSEKSFSICGSVLNIDGKQYKCHSYLTNYITRYGLEE